MQQRITLKLLPSEAANESVIQQYAAQSLGVSASAITGFQVIKRSIDARGRQAWIMLTITAFVNEPFSQRTVKNILLQDVATATQQVIIVGAGPAGLFAALKLIEQGIKPILLERGKDVRARRRDLAALNKEGIVNPESNYCFGEGGAGTYSDGKLYTRSTKRGDVERILNILVQFGAQEKILYEAHPHIGTNKLPEIITAIREQIRACGGVFLFEQKVTGFLIKDSSIYGVETASGDTFHANAVILATGHSARDIFELLHSKNILIEAKPFALGVRVEHPQSIIDTIQYHCAPGKQRDDFLPPAAYSLVQQVNDRGVFSFCMCPGGIIAPAATSAGELVVNGWSPSKRNNPFANSGIVTAVEVKDVIQFQKKPSPLSGMYFQQAVERKAFQYGGGKFVAPAQRMVDFTQGKLSSSLPDCSYLPGITSAPLKEVLPSFVAASLQQAFIEFGKKMRGYFTNEAVLVATESRTSSPVRIPRDGETTQHPQINMLFPCGEGAGYAGGIVSAAMDGERVAENIVALLGA
ncbi:FAD-binding protein [Niastella koreensis]|uniref:Monooxygenase FAD-binding protein n=2 Tax=Niastella koreensis TaxID=354356 RepID=G8TE30_NIAKG|nr:FAD-binding protein [Niastella koreensis]AEW03578.1 monooxygenase FAD-binding protein [Niastella koreensis GR20-10]OQP53938.1 FAD-binding protein [Niastella koreensis]